MYNNYNTIIKYTIIMLLSILYILITIICMYVYIYIYMIKQQISPAGPQRIERVTRSRFDNDNGNNINDNNNDNK